MCKIAPEIKITGRPIHRQTHRQTTLLYLLEQMNTIFIRTVTTPHSINESVLVCILPNLTTNITGLFSEAEAVWLSRRHNEQ